MTYRFSPPEENGFCRHTDQETGVPPWWQPFSENIHLLVSAEIGASREIGCRKRPTTSALPVKNGQPAGPMDEIS